MQLLETLRARCKDSVFFRGGQCHGQLAKAAVPAAFSQFFAEKQSSLEECVAKLAATRDRSSRGAIMRDFLNEALETGRIFKARQYFAKRLTELVILASRTAARCGAPGAMDMEVAEVDEAADTWPVGTSTLQATQRIFTGITNERGARQAIRVVQRCLGGGQRRVPFKSVSALLCFWKRS